MPYKVQFIPKNPQTGELESCWVDSGLLDYEDGRKFIHNTEEDAQWEFDLFVDDLEVPPDRVRIVEVEDS
jgi:hypothetical protein